MNVPGVRLLLVVCLGLGACHRANKPISTAPVASNAAPPSPAIGSARPQDGLAVVCGEIKPDEPKQFVLRLSTALEQNDLITWNGLQSARFRQSSQADPELTRMRLEAWKKAFRDRMPEQVGMSCRMESRDTSIACDTQKPLRIKVTREGCELKLDDN